MREEGGLVAWTEMGVIEEGPVWLQGWGRCADGAGCGDGAVWVVVKLVWVE